MLDIATIPTCCVGKPKMEGSSLADLPRSVLIEIASNVTSSSSLSALAQSCRDFYSCTRCDLFRAKWILKWLVRDRSEKRDLSHVLENTTYTECLGHFVRLLAGDMLSVVWEGHNLGVGTWLAQQAGKAGDTAMLTCLLRSKREPGTERSMERYRVVASSAMVAAVEAGEHEVGGWWNWRLPSSQTESLLHGPPTLNVTHSAVRSATEYWGNGEGFQACNARASMHGRGVFHEGRLHAAIIPYTGIHYNTHPDPTPTVCAIH